MLHYVYILKCKDGSNYVGITKNIKVRMKYHLNGGSIATKSRLPVQLVFFCAFPNKYKAAEFEKYLKSHSGKAFLSKRLV